MFVHSKVLTEPILQFRVALKGSEERAMEIVRLPVGMQASVDVDCIRIEEIVEGRYKLSASALCSDADENDSVSISGTQLFETLEEAEANGLAWAESIAVERLFVSVGTQAQPLELLDIDKPL